MEHQLVAVEDGILKIVGKLNGIEVASIGAKLAEHTVAQVVTIIVEHPLLASRLGIFGHVRDNLNGAVGARLLAKRASRTLVTAILVALENKAPAMTASHMERSLAVLGILLCRLVGPVVLTILLDGSLHAYGQGLHGVPEFAEI